METQNNRRKWLLATVLALLGAATLCVWGVAAAGVRFSSPPLEAAIQAFNETRAQPDRAVISVGGNVDISNPGDGSGNGGDENGNGNGNGDGSGNGNGSGNGTDANGCLLGILCLDADVSTGALTTNGLNIDVDADTNQGIHVNADANTGTQRCFLGLLCINSNTDAGLSPSLLLDSASTVELNTQPLLNGLDVNAAVDADATDTIAVDVNADANTGNNSLLQNLLNLFVNVN